jgi:alpha-1,6-mannosyltransferase
MRIVQAASFVSPRSGGIRTALDALGRGYAEAGHEAVLLVPGPRDRDERTPAGRRVTVRAPRLPASGGYRLLVERRPLLALLERLAPDRLEVSDKSTLRWLGPWARANGVPAVTISHERLDALLQAQLGRLPPARLAAELLQAQLGRLPPARLAALADAWNRGLAAAFDTVVCASAWASEEFTRIGARNLARVPLGVDLATFSPAMASDRLRSTLVRRGEALLVYAGRLSAEKRPDLAVQALAHLLVGGRRARLVVAGDGPRRRALERAAATLPVTSLGFVPDRAELARLLASADAVISPGPLETFGLAALEALASGTPLVTAATGTLPELLAPGAGVAVPSRPKAVALGLETVLGWDPAARRAAARGPRGALPGLGRRVLGYVLVCTDLVALRRWSVRVGAGWALATVGRLLSGRLRGQEARFHLLRLRDGWAAFRHAPPAPMPGYVHLNLAPAARAGIAGLLLARYADGRCRRAGLPGWFAEMNARRGTRAAALASGGIVTVHQQPNATLSWLAGRPVERLTIVRQLGAPPFAATPSFRRAPGAAR